MREINTFPSISSLKGRVFPTFRHKNIRVQPISNGHQRVLSHADTKKLLYKRKVKKISHKWTFIKKIIREDGIYRTNFKNSHLKGTCELTALHLGRNWTLTTKSVPCLFLISTAMLLVPTALFLISTWLFRNGFVFARSTACVNATQRVK